MENKMSGWENFLRNNPNNFSYWLPHMTAVQQYGISIPKTEIIALDMDMAEAFFGERPDDHKKVSQWVHEHVMPVINKSFANEKKIFIKNGCYSGKFNFANNCLIKDPTDEKDGKENICRIQYDSLCFDTGGNLEIVIREYIEPEKDTPTIYNGMPLRPEVRIFYNFDTHQYLYSTNYWEWTYCHDAIARNPKDAKVYEETYPFLDATTRHRLVKHLPAIMEALKKVTTLTMPDGLPNIWSVDFILEENRVWLIDMAIAWQSAYWNPVKAGIAANSDNIK